MQIWRGTQHIPADLPPTAVTIGTFDGVHRGHQQLLGRLTQAGGGRLLPVVVTFDPHPLVLLRPEAAPRMLTTLARRLELLAESGVGAVLVLPFDEELAARSAEWFVVHMLAARLHAEQVMVGRNFRFGHRAAGDVSMLAEYGRELGFAVDALELACAVGGRPVSSTAIRALLQDGNVDAAAELLGRAHRLPGVVEQGDQRGRELGYPTANLGVAAELAVPADGVYAGWLRDQESNRVAAISIGTNPTFAGTRRRVEAYVLDAPAGYDIYGQSVDVDFAVRLRPTQRFDTVAELVAQMAADVAATRRLLG